MDVIQKLKIFYEQLIKQKNAIIEEINKEERKNIAAQIHFNEEEIKRRDAEERRRKKEEEDRRIEEQRIKEEEEKSKKNSNNIYIKYRNSRKYKNLEKSKVGKERNYIY